MCKLRPTGISVIGAWPLIAILVAILALPLATGCSGTPDAQIAAKYDSHCAPCHDNGAADAPIRGAEDSWKPRLEKGLDTLSNNVATGIIGMPPMGRCFECSPEELRALVEYTIGN